MTALSNLSQAEFGLDRIIKSRLPVLVSVLSIQCVSLQFNMIVHRKTSLTQYFIIVLPSLYIMYISGQFAKQLRKIITSHMQSGNWPFNWHVSLQCVFTYILLQSTLVYQSLPADKIYPTAYPKSVRYNGPYITSYIITFCQCMETTHGYLQTIIILYRQCTHIVYWLLCWMLLTFVQILIQIYQNCHFSRLAGPQSFSGTQYMHNLKFVITDYVNRLEQIPWAQREKY